MLVEIVVVVALVLLGLRMVFYAERCQEPITSWHNRIRHNAFISPTVLRLSGHHYEWLFRIVGTVFLLAALALLFHVVLESQPQ